MKALILSILIITSISVYSQSVYDIEERPETCCQHLDEEYSNTWTMLFWTLDIVEAQRLIDRYQMFDIANDYFESNGDYYVELVDPSDTLEYLTKYKLPLYTHKMKSKLIYIDFIVNNEGEIMADENGNKLMIR